MASLLIVTYSAVSLVAAGIGVLNQLLASSLQSSSVRSRVSIEVIA